MPFLVLIFAKSYLWRMFACKKVFEAIGCLLFILTITSCALRQEKHAGDTTSENTERLFAYGICVDSLQVNRYVIQKGDNLASILLRLGFSGAEGENITAIISDLYPPSKLQIGNVYAAITSPDTALAVRYLVFESSKTDFVVVDLCSDFPKAYADTKPVTLQRRYAEKNITSSLWNAIIDAGASPMLAMKLSDIYAWQIDFFDIKEGDSFRLIYDEAWIDDTTFVEIVDIAGAVFNHQGQEYLAVPFRQDSTREYFDADGNSLRKEFLKAPLDFFRISSKFSNARLHPVLKRYRPHHGVDYAAPTGTPVKTIGDGVVIEKAYQRGGAGNYLKIKHNNAYTTTYMHLSRFAKGIQKGTAVKQGEVIGFVGSTGLSTGPHLDFRVHRHNQPINPLKMEAPPALPVKPELRDSFLIVRQNLLQLMDSLQQKG